MLYNTFSVLLCLPINYNSETLTFFSYTTLSFKCYLIAILVVSTWSDSTVIYQYIIYHLSLAIHYQE